MKPLTNSITSGMYSRDADRKPAHCKCEASLTVPGIALFSFTTLIFCTLENCKALRRKISACPVFFPAEIIGMVPVK